MIRKCGDEEEWGQGRVGMRVSDVRITETWFLNNYDNKCYYNEKEPVQCVMYNV